MHEHTCILYLVIGAPEVLDKLGHTFHTGEIEPDDGDLLAASGPHDGLPRGLALGRVPAAHHQPSTSARHGKGCVVANPCILVSDWCEIDR